VLSEFDRAVARRRKELIEEFKLEGNLPEDFDEKKSVPQRSPVPKGLPDNRPVESNP